MHLIHNKGNNLKKKIKDSCMKESMILMFCSP